MPDSKPPTGPPDNTATVNLRELVDLIREGDEQRSSDVMMLADRLASSLAERLQPAGRLSAIDEEHIRDYEVVRRQLAGPFDDEADVVGIGRIVSITSTSTSPTVKPGDAIAIRLRNTGPALRVVFASDPDTVAVTPDSSRTARAGKVAEEVVTVVVPERARTGPVSVETDEEIVTSRVDLVVTTSSGDPSVAPPAPRRNR